MFSGIIFWDISIKDSDIKKLDKNDIVMCLKEKINIIYAIEESKILLYFYDKHCIEVNCDVNLEDLKANMKGFNDLLQLSYPFLLIQKKHPHPLLDLYLPVSVKLLFSYLPLISNILQKQ